jgi:hypothetical protein
LNETYDLETFIEKINCLETKLHDSLSNFKLERKKGEEKKQALKSVSYDFKTFKQVF